ncbi:disease resistance protein RGA5-like [Triticum dicoccoides]|uniref:disease resistance protein RGA5-like n=1 Tax=Triticum dicoccoides TaxID=85692 RepID=UPI000E7B67AD|nr:disease resistance protein RGA5-like [Triticum dicoccoides]XP_037416055.1 disease resistance protein RGA5-like [Triticum dicoccoides]XP_037416056.1 disease resistance protein RGA5-like [Triticum dicoccoides]
MAGIMVSASTGVMNSLLGKLATLMGDEFAKLKNLRKEVKYISDELSSMKDALERLADVDELDIQTARWRDAVREMSYDIEDIIDDFMCKIGEKSKKSGFVHDTIQRLKTARARHQIAGQIEDIKKLVCETSERRERYKLDVPTSRNVAVDQRVVALYASADKLVGMEGPTNELVSWLKDEENKLKVVSIVGFGGLGKTTLANQVYHKLEGEFQCGAFVSVSQKPNIPKLLQSLLTKLGCRQSFHDAELTVLLDHVIENLKNKRYLVIIDDLWDVSAWNIIKCAFPENNLGSRLIVTTRIKTVAEACFGHHEHILEMKPLSEENSRKLFFDRIFCPDGACPGQLKDVSIEILKKCGGLPLAIISISSLLASESSHQKERWKHVQNSLGSVSGTNITLEAMRHILNLSYKNLPHHLKTCFLYLGMFPEDSEIHMYKLVSLWISEGFVSKARGQSREQTAISYFNELVNRSLIQPTWFDTDGSVITCKVHDMLLDLIWYKCAEENFITVVDNLESVTTQLRKPRRMLFNLDGATLPGFVSMSQVRSFATCRSSMNIPSLAEFKYLRVFIADFYSSSADDNRKIDLTGLCKLYQLRHIQIHRSDKCQLPEQIRGLQKLETFDVDGSCIPMDIFHLPCLLDLLVPSVKRLPEGIGKMKSLQRLGHFDTLHTSLDSIKGLGELTNLTSLHLKTGFSEDVDMDVLNSSLGKLCNLEFLLISSPGDSWIPEALTLSPPPPSLVKLHMMISSHVPNWIGELHNLQTLNLTVEKLDKDGVGILAELPALINLRLRFGRALEETIAIDGTTFAILKRFHVCCETNMPHLTFQVGAMPKLKRLSLWWNQDENAPLTGIEHLLALERISVRRSGTESEQRSAESAIRSAITMHPNHAYITIDNKHY